MRTMSTILSWIWCAFCDMPVLWDRAQHYSHYARQFIILSTSCLRLVVYNCRIVRIGSRIKLSCFRLRLAVCGWRLLEHGWEATKATTATTQSLLYGILIELEPWAITTTCAWSEHPEIVSSSSGDPRWGDGVGESPWPDSCIVVRCS